MSDAKTEVWMKLGDADPVEIDYSPLEVAAMMTKGYRQVQPPTTAPATPAETKVEAPTSHEIPPVPLQEIPQPQHGEIQPSEEEHK